MRTRALLQHRTFGRRPAPQSIAVAAPRASIGDDAKLFAMTFMGGFLFMAIYLG